MLVLSRKLGEQVVIPQCEMTVTIVAIEGNNVRLGFTAPRDVDVYRQEVLERKRQAEAQLCAKRSRATEDRAMMSANFQDSPGLAFRDDWAAELTTAAYLVALRHCPTSHWLELQLELWRALSATVARRGRELAARREPGADELLAELAYLAYRIALPYGGRRSFLDLELELYHAFRGIAIG